VTLRVPPLRERREDIPILSGYFLRAQASRLNKRVLGFDQEVVPKLSAHPWPGNVRQLRNAVGTAVLNCHGVLLRMEDFAPDVWQGDGEDAASSSLTPASDVVRELAASTLEDAVAEFERRLLTQVFEETEGNVTRASERLGIGRTALHRKMRQRGVRRHMRGDEQGEVSGDDG
jgi:DNA-binding NtrC family response regulator